MAEPRWLDDDEQQAWRSYLRMNSLLSAALNRQLQAESQLSLPDFEVLVRLTDVPEGRLRVHELAKALHWEKSRVSHQIARMRQRGLVGREDCAEDARGAFVVLTPTGREAIEAAAPGHVEAVRQLFLDALDHDGLATLSSLAQRVLARLEAHCESHGELAGQSPCVETPEVV